MVGCLTAVVAVLVASAAGLSAVLLASPRLFDAVRILGAAYLIYLGVRAWRAGEASASLAEGMGTPFSRLVLFRDGLVVGFSNPKLILFATAFLSQFVMPDAPRLPQS